MYLISCRKGFDSNLSFSPENLYRNYTNPADPKVFQDLDLAAILKAAKDKHVLVLVHGFNNPIENVAKSYWELLQGLDAQQMLGPGRPYGLVLGFTWPGNRFSIGFFGAPMKADRSGGRLRDFLNELRTVTLSIDVQTHSLGARVALRALGDPKKKTFVNNLMLAAAAVDDNILEPGETFAASIESCNRCFVQHSKNDPVLKTFPLPDVFDGLHLALGLKGPRSKKITLESSNIYVVDCSKRVTSHGGYRTTPQYYAHWKEILSDAPMHRYDELS